MEERRYREFVVPRWAEVTPIVAGRPVEQSVALTFFRNSGLDELRRSRS